MGRGRTKQAARMQACVLTDSLFRLVTGITVTGEGYKTGFGGRSQQHSRDSQLRP